MQKLFLWVACLGLSTAYAAEPNAIEPNTKDSAYVDVKEPLVTVNSKSYEKTNTADDVDTVQINVQSRQEVNNKLDIDSQKLKILSEHKQWQHLLFYKNGKAEVISPNFYLTDPSVQSIATFSPYKELIATLRHASDNEIVCRYPARYLWLNKHLPELKIDWQNCLDLPNPNQEISLILVSNYLKNPASSFGHVLVKTSSAMDRKENGVRQLSSEDLLNSSYNFGARIPANENGAMYAIKGLFGFYDSGFSEAEFFKHDTVYSKNEQRDMWEYVLNLGAFETQLLNYHLYEAKSARFDYYFIKQNCGYRTGEILELVSDIKTTERVGPWYAPDYVFDQLLEYSDDAAEPLIASVRYLPSEQTQLRAKFVQLPKPIQNVINSVIRTETIAPLLRLNPDDRALAIDFLILHRTYKISQNNTPQHQALKKKLLSQRFTLPASNGLGTLTVLEKASPALSNKTTQTKVVLSEDEAQVGVSLFVKDPLNPHNDINKRFEAVQLSLGYDFDESKLSVTDFVFLDMQQIEDLAQPLAGEPKLSWQLKTGARTDLFTGDNHSPYGQAGVGAGVMLGRYALGYGMVNATVHDQDRHLDVGIELGLRAKKKGQAAELTYTLNKREGRSSLSQTELTLRQQLSKNNDARIIITHTDTDSNNSVVNDSDSVRAGVAWHHYW
ncbi:DUF4105 domain-containing protein [Psychrobacter immobilis]|uniref:Lnb N-terminal periplasmic domain-containing protein n=1 Tax=Psychrobacter immobilis TaxID=498 RepID=UPI0019184BAF|nr:DUF4105 domain-containing protein [Psychrobacter immobilis]